jgi:hypothetical protein
MQPSIATARFYPNLTFPLSWCRLLIPSILSIPSERSSSPRRTVMWSGSPQPSENTRLQQQLSPNHRVGNNTREGRIRQISDEIYISFEKLCFYYLLWEASIIEVISNVLTFVKFLSLALRFRSPESTTTCSITMPKFILW